MNYYILITDDIVTLFSHEKNRSCEDIKAMVRRVSGNDALNKVVSKMIKEGFKLVSNVDTIDINKEMNKEE